MTNKRRFQKQNCHLFVLLLLANFAKPSKMTKIEFFTDVFRSEIVPTEYYAFQLFQKKPLNTDVYYLAVPWTPLINGNQLAKVPRSKINDIKFGFSVCQHIHYEKIIPILQDIGIDTLFTPHVIKGKKYDGLTVLPFPHYAVNGVDPAEKKDIWCSFIGFNTDPTRAKLFQLPKQKDVIIKKRSQWHFAQPAKQKEQEKQEYKNVLARSRFSICPRGTGASTIRFWESLRAGAIPVLISDDMTLPDQYDWNNCIIRVDEKDVNRIFDILNKISIQQEEVMRTNCLHCYKLFSGENFISVIRHYYENIFP